MTGMSRGSWRLTGFGEVTGDEGRGGPSHRDPIAGSDPGGAAGGVVHAEHRLAAGEPVGADVGFRAERFTAGLAGDGPQVCHPAVQAVPVDETGYRVGDIDLE